MMVIALELIMRTLNRIKNKWIKFKTGSLKSILLDHNIIKIMIQDYLIPELAEIIAVYVNDPLIKLHTKSGDVCPSMTLENHKRFNLDVDSYSPQFQIPYSFLTNVQNQLRRDEIITQKDLVSAFDYEQHCSRGSGYCGCEIHYTALAIRAKLKEGMKKWIPRCDWENYNDDDILR